MHERFADWYSRITPSPREGLLAQRWKCVESLCSSLDANMAVRLVAYTHNLLDSGTQLSGILAARFKQADSTFPLEGNDNLVRVLAAACLAEVLRQTGPQSDIIALASLSATCRGARAMPADVMGICDSLGYVRQRGLEVRQAAHKQAAASPRFRNISPSKARKYDPLPQIHQDWAVTQTNLQTLFEMVSTLFQEIQATQTNLAGLREDTKRAAGVWSVATGDPRVPVLQEETEILWWLFTRTSTELGVPFADVPKDARPVILAHELASRIRLLPPPECAEPILHRALETEASSAGDTDATHLAHLVEGLPPTWRARYRDRASVAVGTTERITPISTAICEWAESVSAEGQGAPIAQKAGLSQEFETTPGEWACQFLHEVLLIERLRLSAEAVE